MTVMSYKRSAEQDILLGLRVRTYFWSMVVCVPVMCLCYVYM